MEKDGDELYQCLLCTRGEKPDAVIQIRFKDMKAVREHLKRYHCEDYSVLKFESEFQSIKLSGPLVNISSSYLRKAK